jgi:hypothetical protein
MRKQRVWFTKKTPGNNGYYLQRVPRGGSKMPCNPIVVNGKIAGWACFENPTKEETKITTRYEQIKSMSIEEIAEEIIRLNITDEYCKSDCKDTWKKPICQHEKQCCIKWLKEEVKC